MGAGAIHEWDTNKRMTIFPVMPESYVRISKSEGRKIRVFVKSFVDGFEQSHPWLGFVTLPAERE
jgi:hypothetical protein